MPRTYRTARAAEFLVATAMLGLAPGLAAAQDTADTPSIELSDIVVTANKRAERVQDVPISITAISQEALEKQGAQGMSDYLMAQPSVVIQDRGPARNQVVIRGVATTVAFENPTVAFYFGDVPLSTGLGNGALGFPDLKTFDLNRVEVLRGPQGTLYGAGSMGGTVKLVPNEPRLGDTAIHGEASLADTRGGGLSYNAAAAVNVPLTETLAARVVGYHYRQGGFIDNHWAGSADPDLPVAALGGLSWSDVGVSSFGVAAREDANANRTDTSGVRAYLLFQPSDEFSIRLGAVYQDQQSDGLPEAVPSVGDYAQSRFLQEKLKDRFQLYDLTANYDLGIATLTSSSAYMVRKQGQMRDVSAFFLSAPTALSDSNDNKTFVQEVRLTSPSDGRLKWIVGGYYQRATSDAGQSMSWHGTDSSLVEYTSLLTALGALGGPAAAGDTLYLRADDHMARQLAAFGDLSYEIVPTVSAAVGLRWSSYKQHVKAFADGAFNGGSTSSNLRSTERVLTPKFQLEYKPDEDQLYYARVTKGFRPGGPNQALPSTCAADLAELGMTQVPASLKSDQLWSYEAGAKTRLADGKVILNAAAFYIDWTDIQTSFLLPGCGFNFSSNAGKAKSQGLELEFSARLTKALQLSLQAAFTDATLRADSPSGSGIGGLKGDRLPGIPRWTVAGSLEYDFTLGAHDGFLRGDIRFMSDYSNRFPGDTSGVVKDSGDFMVTDLRAGLSLDAHIRAEVFAENVFDVRQTILVDTELPDAREVLGRPRTIGVTMRVAY